MKSGLHRQISIDKKTYHYGSTSDGDKIEVFQYDNGKWGVWTGNMRYGIYNSFDVANRKAKKLQK